MTSSRRRLRSSLAEEDMTSWLQDRIDDLRGFQGSSISRWVGTEMSLTVDRPGGELWDDERIPWLQMVELYCETGEGDVYRFACYQDDCEFGLFVSPVPVIEPWQPDEHSIYRWVELPYLPVGVVESVGYALYEARILSEITLAVGDHAVQMRSGEVCEQEDGVFQLHWLDESVMVQVDKRHPRSAG